MLAQDLENIGKERLFRLSGSAQLSTVGYAAQGIAPRRDPWTWVATGQLNVAIHGWNIPLSFSYTNRQAKFQQPFNRYGVSPHYRWAKIYLGYNSLNYSAYTLGGHIFLGGAVELTPQNYRLQVMYGQLQKATLADTALQAYQPSAYQRMGTGIKFGYGTAANSIDVIVFYAKDRAQSLLTLPDSLMILPAENLVCSVLGKKTLANRWLWDMEWAGSILTRDTRASPVSAVNGRLLRVSRGFISVKNTTTSHQAFKTGVTYTLAKGSLQGTYQRIAPDYQTLGSYYVANDLENISLGLDHQFWKDRLNVSIQSGVQRNNLDKTAMDQTHRWVGNLGANLSPNEHWQLSASYSNFTTFTNVRPETDPFFRREFDSLNFYQVNQNASYTASYQFGTKEYKKSITLSTAYQKAKEASSDTENPAQLSSYYSGNLAYRIACVPMGMSVSVGSNLHRSVFPEIITTTLGPVVSLSKALCQKLLQSSVTTTFNQVTTNEMASSRVVTARMSHSYAHKKKHQLALSISMLKKLAVAPEEIGFTEWTATLRYGYTF